MLFPQFIDFLLKISVNSNYFIISYDIQYYIIRINKSQTDETNFRKITDADSGTETGRRQPRSIRKNQRRAERAGVFLDAAASGSKSRGTPMYFKVRSAIALKVGAATVAP